MTGVNSLQVLCHHRHHCHPLPVPPLQVCHSPAAVAAVLLQAHLILTKRRRRRRRKRRRRRRQINTTTRSQRNVRKSTRKERTKKMGILHQMVNWQRKKGRRIKGIYLALHYSPVYLNSIEISGFFCSIYYWLCVSINVYIC